MLVYQLLNHASRDNFHLSVNGVAERYWEVIREDFDAAVERFTLACSNTGSESDAAVPTDDGPWFKKTRATGYSIMRGIALDGANCVCNRIDYVEWCAQKNDVLCALLENMVANNRCIAATLTPDVWREMMRILLRYELCLFMEEHRIWGLLDISMGPQTLEACFSPPDAVCLPACNFPDYDTFCAKFEAASQAYDDIITQCVCTGIANAGGQNRFSFATVLSQGHKILHTLIAGAGSEGRDSEGRDSAEWCRQRNLSLYVRLSATMRTFLAFNDHVYALPHHNTFLLPNIPGLLKKRLEIDVFRFMGTIEKPMGLSAEVMATEFVEVQEGSGVVHLPTRDLEAREVHFLLAWKNTANKLAVIEESLIEYILRDICFVRTTQQPPAPLCTLDPFIHMCF